MIVFEAPSVENFFDHLSLTVNSFLPSLQLVLGLAWCAIFSNLSSCFSYFLFFSGYYDATFRETNLERKHTLQNKS